MAGHFLHRALFIGPNARKAINEGRAEFIPVFLSDIPSLFDTGILPLDAALVNVSPARRAWLLLARHVRGHGARRHPLRQDVIAQLNKSMPRTLGDSFVHVSTIDFGVEVDLPPYEHADPPISDVERRIGEYVADLVPDEATLQMGIGAIPSAVCLTSTTRRTWASTPRCSPTSSSTSSSGAW